jgi:hypothetical protein
MAHLFIAKTFPGRQASPRAVATALGGGIAAACFLYVFDPARSALYAPCPFHLLTGLYCPGCGSLRALHQLLHGHLRTAWGLNPLLVVALPFLGYCFLSYVMGGLRGRSLLAFFVPAIVIWAFLGAVLVFWVLRNVAWFLVWLAPIRQP